MGTTAKTEHDPIADDEFILRRIHKNDYKVGRNPPVVRVAFEPRPNDHDGGSFQREGFVSIAKLAASGRKPGEYYIAKFSVAALRAPPLNLTIDPTPDPDTTQPRGHCSVRELSIGEMTKDKNKSKGLQNALAEIASKNIVYVPSGCQS